MTEGDLRSGDNGQVPSDTEWLTELCELSVFAREARLVELAEVDAARARRLRAELARVLREPESESGSEFDDAERPRRIGPYHVLGVLGSGGMGTVYKAERRHPVRQLVAVKVIQERRRRPDILARFDLERRALAAMNHLCIAKVFDAGVTTAGAPYLVMECIEGRPLVEYCDAQKLSLGDRIDLFMQVCRGVHHIHTKGIVHRDLKPDNVLVTREAERMVPKIVDFGIAKATNRGVLGETIVTVAGQIMGTPEYMSPEQASGSGDPIDSLSDVYSLGVILYELLTGTLPFERRRLNDAGLVEALRILREEEPPRPSTRLSTLVGATSAEVASRRRTTLVALTRSLRSDLDWIILKAIAKDPRERYQSALALADDLQRFLDLEPVHAGPPTARYRLSKLLRKHRRALLSAAALFVALTGALLFSIFMAVEAEAAYQGRLDAERRAAREQAASESWLLAGGAAELARQADEELWPIHDDFAARVEAWGERLAVARQRIAETEGLLAAMQEEGFAEAAAALQRLRDGGRQQELLRVEDEVRARAERFAALALEWSASLPKWRELQRRLDARDDFGEFFRLPPQRGLIPLGPDPHSGLEEFEVVWTGQPWARREDGEFDVVDLEAQRRRLVLALVPGTDAFTPSFAEGQSLALEPFLVAKTELTQGQWIAMAGGNPSHYPPGSLPFRDLLNFGNPVESLSWELAMRWLPRFGLTLPTEAQWEYAARGRSNGAYADGDDPEVYRGDEQPVNGGGTLRRGYLNIADASMDDVGGLSSGYREWPDYYDGFAIHAPVHRAPWIGHPFGLRDVHGNVFEWCLGPAFSDPAGPGRLRDGDGAKPTGYDRRADIPVRGGSWHKGISDARLDRRRWLTKSAAYDDVGLRPVWVIRR